VSQLNTCGHCARSLPFDRIMHHRTGEPETNACRTDTYQTAVQSRYVQIRTKSFMISFSGDVFVGPIDLSLFQLRIPIKK